VTFSPASPIVLTNITSGEVIFKFTASKTSAGGDTGNLHFNDIVINGTAALIPEPSTYAVLGGIVGMGVIMISRRRRE
jgi:hypothetical protein